MMGGNRTMRAMRPFLRRRTSARLAGAAGPAVHSGATLPLGASVPQRLKPILGTAARRRLAALLVVLGIAGAGSLVAGTYLLLHNFRRIGDGHWSASYYLYFSVLGLSLLLGIFGGLWLWWRAPSLSTGLWLWFAAFSLSLWVIGTYWPSAWGMQLYLFIYCYRPALAMVLFGWPTGRPATRVRRWIFG